MQPIDTKKAVFALCAKNCSATLTHVLANVSRISVLFSECAFVFVENDSRDATKEEVRRWCARQTNARIICLDGLDDDCPVRTIRLERARNRYLSVIRADFRDYDYLFVIDCDEVNAGPVNLGAVKRAVEFLEQDPNHAGAFANTLGFYYDMWALRHPELCPGDVWEEVCDYVMAHGASDEEALRATLLRRVFSLPPDSMPLEVESAFGGFGIYKVKNLLENHREYVGHKLKHFPAGIAALDGAARTLGWQCCEHVSFNAGFRELGGKLFIMPYLLNCRVADDNIPATAWRTFLFPPGQGGWRLDVADSTVPVDPVGRNQPCSCGSGKRYKHCHGVGT